MDRKTVLDGAAAAVLRDRQATHGAPENSFPAIASMWATIFGVPVQPWQVPLALAALKIVRANTTPTHADNWVDLAGYAACGGELASNDEPEFPGLDPSKWGSREIAEFLHNRKEGE